MKSKLPASKRNIKRISQILTILTEEGFDFIARKIGMAKLVSLSCRIKSFFKRAASTIHLRKEEPVEKRIRRVIERLGTTFVKIGQILSMRNDLLPQKLCDELQHLQSSVPFIPFERVKECIEKAYNKDLSQLFASINEKPLAAASISQVHEAVLHTGEEVVVKIQRPEVEEQVLSDLEILLWLAKNIEKFIPGLRVYRPYENAREFADYTVKELDFHNEAKITERFYQIVPTHDNMYSPKIYSDMVRKNVLVMEKIKGRGIDPVNTLEADGFDRLQLSRQLASGLLHQIFAEGLFHADPHPGNIILMEDKRICLIDFGMYGEVDSYLQRKILKLLYYISERDIVKAVKHLISLTTPLEGADYQGYYSDILSIFDQWLGSSLHEMSMAQAVFQAMQHSSTYGFQFPTGLVLMIKAIITIESIATLVSPEIQFSEELKDILRDVMFKKMDITQFQFNVESILPDLWDLLKHLPDAAEIAVDYLQKHREYTPPAKQSSPINLIIPGMISGFIFLGGIILLTRDINPQSLFLLIPSGIMMAGVLLRSIFK